VSEPQRGQPKLYIFPHAGTSVDFHIPYATAFSRRTIWRPWSAFPVARMTFTQCLRQMIRQAAITLFAFEVARRVESTGNPIAALFVSGGAAPSRRRFDQLPEADGELLDTVTPLTALDLRTRRQRAVADTVLTTLRSLEAIGDHVCSSVATVSCPTDAFVGDNDATATDENVAALAEHTTSDFAIRALPDGDHDINDSLTELGGDIEQSLSRLCQRGSRGGPERCRNTLTTASDAV
jgi:hypothetical protein